uniref:Uncharacterized protein n=1 Tax=Xiphophorus couchianus TaxID=32473 RepID=A0A3B5LWH4_9TELE
MPLVYTVFEFAYTHLTVPKIQKVRENVGNDVFLHHFSMIGTFQHAIFFFLHQTLRRKGHGLDGSELDSEESAQAAADKYPGSDSMDLSVARQRFCPPSLLSPETQFLVSAGCENGFPNSSASGAASHRPPGFKALSSRPGSASPAGPHPAFMSPHPGIGYSMFSHGNLNRALDMKSPPPLSLGRVTSLHILCFTICTSPHHQRSLLYQGLHSSSSMVAMGKAGLLSHSLGGYGLPPAGASGKSVFNYFSLQMSSGGCSFPPQSCSSNSSHLASLNLSIKSERSSPDHMCSPSSPRLHHLRQHSPTGNADVARHSPPEAHPANRTKEFPKAGYPQDGEERGQPVRQLEMSDGWQR